MTNGGTHHGQTLSIAYVGDDVVMTLTPVTERADGTQPEALVVVGADNAMGHLVSVEAHRAGQPRGAPTTTYTIDFVASMPSTGTALRIARHIVARSGANALTSGAVVGPDSTLIASASGWFRQGGAGPATGAPISTGTASQLSTPPEAAAVILSPFGDLDPAGSPIARTLGLELTDATAEHVAMRVANVTSLLNGNGGLHGGVTGLAMTLAAEAMASTADAVARPLHVDLQYWRPLGTDHRPVSITVDMVRRGNTTATATATGYTTDGRPGVQATIVLALG
ncbi:MAG: acyl-CoA thioesterase domain-containing protein [Acidimicrobiia bacterium]